MTSYQRFLRDFFLFIALAALAPVSALAGPLPVTIVSGLTANDKAYDGTTAALIRSNNVVLAGIDPADVGNVALSTNNYVATFSDINVGTGKSVTVTGLYLTGSAAGKYRLSPAFPQLTADIGRALVFIANGLTANSKIYDGTRTATISSNNVVLAGLLPLDVAFVALSTNGYSASFPTPAAGLGRTVAVVGLTLTGSSANNYFLIQEFLTANINPATVTISSGLTANDRDFDSTTVATLSSNNVALAGVLAGDIGNVALSTNNYTATFANTGPGDGIPVNVGGLTLTGSTRGNYSLTQPTLSANIAPLTAVSITSGIVANSKIYDRIATTTLSSNNVVLAGIAPEDVGNVALSTNNYSAFFDDPNVGNGKRVTVTGLHLTGSAAGKYLLPDVWVGLAASITPAPLTVVSGLVANDKIYNGLQRASISSNNVVLAGILPGDEGHVALSTNNYSAVFDDINIGNGKPVFVTGLSFTGSASGNYALRFPWVELAANITPATVAIVSGLTADNKTYDGTTTASLSSNNIVLVGVGGWDPFVALSTNGYTAMFINSAVGPHQPVAVRGLTLTGQGAGNYVLAQPSFEASISAAAVSISSGLAADNKVYDGTATASLSSNNVVLAGVLAADVDNVALSTNDYAATFAGWGVGPGQSVTVSGLTLTGSAGGNYLLTQPSLVADINARPVSITSGLEADNKFYDGTAIATLSSNSVVLAGVLAGDASSVALSTNNYTATFASSALGPGQSVTVSGLALTGFAADNYFLVQPSLAADIAAAPVTISSGLTANNKVYDGTTSATLNSNNVVLTGILAADAGNVDLSTNGYTATFASAAVGPGQIVTVSGLALTGAAAGNYSIIQPNLAADIAGIPVIINSGLTANDKPYDGTAVATLSSNNVVLSGVQLADVDNVSLSTNGYTAAFNSSAIGSGQNVSVFGLTLTGSAAGHYSLSQPNLVADITGAAVTITSGLLANDKIYDGTTSATLSSNNVVLAGVVATDVDNVSVSTNGYTASFADSTAAVGKNVTVNGLTLTGSAAAHYTLIQPVPTATIAPAPLVVTADNVSRLYGALNPSISGNISGGQNGDLIIARFVAQADPTSPVGDYPIAVSLSADSVTLANYNVTTNVGFLQVLPAPLTITASNATRPYGATNPAFAGTIDGLMNGDNITATYTCTADATNEPGIYPISPAVVSPANLQTNYLVTLVNGTLTIVPPEFVLALMQTGDSVLLRWGAIAGQRYQVQYSINASPVNWRNLVTVTATNSTATASDAIDATAHRFYRTIWLP